MKTPLLPAALLLLSAVFIFSCSNQSATDVMTTEAAVTEAAALPDTALASGRVVVKSAELALDVKQVEPTMQQFQQMLQPLGGKIYHYELDKQILSSNETEHSLDSTLQVREVSPTGQIKIRVPVQYGDSFIATVLKMDASVTRFYFDEQDITEDITEQKELMLSDAGAAKKPGAHAKAKAQREDRESYIQRKADFSRMAYRTKNLWFDVRLNGQTYTEHRLLASAQTIRSPFYVRASHALQDGWYGFSVFLSLLLQVWPFILLAALLLVLLRRRKVPKAELRSM